MIRLRPCLRFCAHATIAALVVTTVPWLLGAACAATGDAVIPPPTPDAIAAYLTAYGPIVGVLTVAYVLAGWALRKWASSHWLAQGKRLAWATALSGIGGTALKAFVSGTPVSGVVATAVLGFLHIADAQVTPAPVRTGQGGFTRTDLMLMLAAAGVALFAAMGCGASQRETTIRTSVAAADGIRDTFLAYDGPHELELVAKAVSKEDAQAKLSAYQAKRSATIDKAMIVVYRAIAVAATLNDQPSLDGIKSALDQLNAAYKALKETP